MAAPTAGAREGRCHGHGRFGRRRQGCKTAAARRRPRLGSGPGRVLIKAAGVPAEGLSTLASFDAGDVGAELPRPGDACRSGHQDIGRPRVSRQRQRAARHAGRSVTAAESWTACRSAAGSVSPWRRRDRPRRLAANIGGKQVGRPRNTLAGRRPAPHRGQPRSRRGKRCAGCSRRCSISAWRSPAWPRLRSRAGRAYGPTSRSAPPCSMHSRAISSLNCRRLVVADGVALEGAKVDIAFGGGKIEISRHLRQRARRTIQGKAADCKGGGRRRGARRTRASARRWKPSPTAIRPVPAAR